MSKYKLTYFNFDGGRGESIRIAFHSAGIDFEDNRVTFPEFGEIRSTLPFNCVPVLEIDGVAVTQSIGINAYVGKLAGLYPSDDLQALYCDEALGAVEDMTHYLVQTFGLEGEDLKQAREKLADGWLTIYLKGLARLLTRGGGEYFAGNKLTVADLSVFVQTRALCSGNLDHIPTDLVQQVAPGLMEHHMRIGAESRVDAYYASRS